VCILETHANTVSDPVRGSGTNGPGLSRTMTLIDLTIRGLSPGNYWATVRETG
jgi:copper chaperone for superoxide dismutase